MEQHHGDNYETTSTGGDRIKLNVGGKLFETTATTLRSGGPDSLLSALSLRPDPNPVFIDRDPDIFSVLLSLLRSNRLPGSGFSTQELIEEAAYYGIEGLVKSATSPVEFSGIDASRTAMIRPASEGFSTQELTEETAYYGTESLVRSATSLMEFSGIVAGVIATIRTASEGIVSSLSALLDGSLLVAHGGQVSSYDWSISHVSTIRTHLEDIAAIRGVMPQIAAIGSYYNQGLHFYSLNSGRRVGSVDWSDPTDPRIYKARVGSITDSDDSVFASFDCPHRENAILQIDKQTLKSISEIGRQKGSSTKTGVASKLAYLPDPGIIFGCSVTSSAFGYSGYVRLWDPRSGGVVWETNEPGSGRSSRFGDSFADVDVDVEGATMFKVCSKSGDLGVADLRKLGEDPWVYLVDKNPSMRYVEGVGSSVLCCYKKQVFVGREGGLEVWSRVEEREEVEERESLFHEEAFRRNFVDKVEDSKRGLITKIEGGGDRLFVCREDVEGVEVWESSGFSGVVSV